MTKKKLIYPLSALIALGAVTLFAQGQKSAEGKLTLSKKNYELKNAIAYETATAGEEEVAVVMTAGPISNEKLKKSLAAEKAGESGEFPSPYLKLSFKKTGELKYWNATGGGTTIGGSSDGTGELKIQDGHAVGKANAAVEPGALIPKGFDVQFNVALLKSGEELPASTTIKYGPAANVKPSVSGTFKGNGKAADLTHVSARWVEPFSGKTGILLLFTEKEHSSAKKPDVDAMFGKFGNALIISLHEDGDIYSCQVVHNAMKNKGFSSSGSIETTGFNYDAGKVEGELTTNGSVDTFGENWEVKLKFIAPLGEIAKEYRVTDSTETTPASVKREKSESAEPEEKMETKPAAPGLKAKDLALTKDATDVEYKALVEQMSFKSKLPVKNACADLSANLKAQGWSKEESDLITPASSILKRGRGEAKLTIFVKPDAGGSRISMMTEGLAWDDQ